MGKLKIPIDSLMPTKQKTPKRISGFLRDSTKTYCWLPAFCLGRALFTLIVRPLISMPFRSSIAV